MWTERDQCVYIYLDASVSLSFPLHLYNLFRKLSDHIINCLQHQFVPAPHEAV